MEITYDLIIKYLSNNNKKNDFEIKKHLIKYSDTFPPKFTEILLNKFYYFGVTLYENKKNISFYMSLLTLLDKDFITLTDKEEIKYYEIFKNSLSNNIIKTKLSIDDYVKNNNILKKDIVENIDIILFQSICEIMDINFIIFNFKTEEIKIVYVEEILNPWKPTLLFANCDDLWYPILYDVNSKRLFSYNDQYIKKIYSLPLQYYENDKFNKEVIITDNLKDIVDKFKKDTNTIFKKEQEYTSDSLKKMTKSQLMEIVKNKNIKNITTKTLKNDIIETILSNIN